MSKVSRIFIKSKKEIKARSNHWCRSCETPKSTLLFQGSIKPGDNYTKVTVYIFFENPKSWTSQEQDYHPNCIPSDDVILDKGRSYADEFLSWEQKNRNPYAPFQVM